MTPTPTIAWRLRRWLRIASLVVRRYLIHDHIRRLQDPTRDHSMWG